MKVVRLLILASGLVGLWQAVVSFTGTPHYILPGPLPVAKGLLTHLPVLGPHLAITLIEILAGLFLGTLLGSLAALTMIISPLLKRWMLPLWSSVKLYRSLPWHRYWYSGSVMVWPPRSPWRF